MLYSPGNINTTINCQLVLAFINKFQRINHRTVLHLKESLLHSWWWIFPYGTLWDRNKLHVWGLNRKEKKSIKSTQIALYVKWPVLHAERLNLVLNHVNLSFFFLFYGPVDIKNKNEEITLHIQCSPRTAWKSNKLQHQYIRGKVIPSEMSPVVPSHTLGSHFTAVHSPEGLNCPHWNISSKYTITKQFCW